MNQNKWNRTVRKTFGGGVRHSALKHSHSKEKHKSTQWVVVVWAAENRMRWTRCVCLKLEMSSSRYVRDKLEALISGALQPICTTFGGYWCLGSVPGARLLVPGCQSVVRTSGDGAGGRGLLAVEGERHQCAEDRPRICHQVHGLWTGEFTLLM